MCSTGLISSPASLNIVFDYYIRFYYICWIIGAKDLPIGVARKIFGRSTISFGMPVPISTFATSSVKLLQLCSSTLYVIGVNRGAISLRNSIKSSSGSSVEPRSKVFVG